MKRIVFVTGTRADFGKLKSLIAVLSKEPAFEVHIFATGMHMDIKYGFTVNEIMKCGFQHIFKFINHDSESLMDITLSRTIEGFANYVRMIQPDLIVVHGDRIEALAGATVGALNNILVAHIEGGELSGTVDELIRHAVSKLSHTHFVANADAKARLIQMGEMADSIFVIGSPDMDVMLSDNLPAWIEVKNYYEIPFETFGVAVFHPVTTELQHMHQFAAAYVDALMASEMNYVVIYPNNDKGSELVQLQIQRLQGLARFRIFPSMRFESFLVAMKRAAFVIGNSSAGIREAPYFGVPTINIGTRQQGRTNNPDIIHVGYATEAILQGIQQALHSTIEARQLFGTGNSDTSFYQILSNPDFWHTPKQKLFADQVHA
jgi:UDP-N-acetylglucosamine 2-epimerase (hydrolysing)